MARPKKCFTCGKNDFRELSFLNGMSGWMCTTCGKPFDVRE